MALASTGQSDFGFGIYRGRKAPQNAVYDATDMLVDDEGNLFERGGSAYYSDSDAGAALYLLYDAYVHAGDRQLVAGASSVYALDGTTPVTLSGLFGSSSPIRGAGIAGTLAIPASGVLFYGGSLKADTYSTGTASVTAGSKTVTGSGTSWTANVDKGMLLGGFAGGNSLGVVDSVNSNTSITLRDNWGGATVSGTYTLYVVAGPSDMLLSSPHVAAVSTVPRLIVTSGNRAYYTSSGNPFHLTTATNFIELPSSSLIIGALGAGSTVWLFTTEGLWAIENVELEPVDDYGNIQWAQSLVNANLILWGDAGVAAYGPNAVVPAIDDVFVLGANGAAKPITDAIRPLYRSYVKAGYQPGLAVVHRGHYLLPILDGTTLVDVLMCRLDRGFAWTRLSGGAASFSYAVQIGSSSRSPKLLGLSGQRVTDLSDIFDPTSSNSTDADGTAVAGTVTTRDFPMGDPPALTRQANLTYELTSDGTHTPTVAVAYSSDEDGGSFTTLTDRGITRSTGTGGTASNGSAYHWWKVGKRRNRIRFKITRSGAAATFVLRSLELLIRPTGRR